MIGDIWADFWARPGIVDFHPLPLGVIVTVAGTGSEMNGGAVITNEEQKIKTGRDYPTCNAKFALMDPTYTYSVPKKQMVSGGFDILSHIMETYFSEPDEGNVSDDIAETLMRGVIRDLRAAIQNPEDYTARSNLMWESAMAENRIIKLGKRMDFECHQMEHQLGAYTNLQSWRRTGSAASGLLSSYLQGRTCQIPEICSSCLGHFTGRQNRGRVGARWYRGACRLY